ncbi:MAG: hypothetical protein IIZ78_22580 [Clostridiales bacterium]|nr:hypothetical protein [Clostridiales bacterium]
MFEQIVDVITNNGVGIACILYFMLRDFKFMEKLTDTVASLNSTLEELQLMCVKLGIDRRSNNGEKQTK